MNIYGIEIQGVKTVIKHDLTIAWQDRQVKYMFDMHDKGREDYEKMVSN